MNVFKNPKFILRSVYSVAAALTGQASRWQKEAQPPWRILMYHRVLPKKHVDYTLEPGMYVTPESFELHCEYLQTNCTVIPLSTLEEKILSGAPIEPGTVCMTFDDGWRDNYEFAAPILKQYKLPATVFLATGFVAGFDTFWTDKVSIWLTALQKSLQSLERASFDAAPENVFQQMSIATKLRPQTAHAEEVLANIISELKRLPISTRQAILAQLEKISEQCPRFPKLNRSFLNWSEINHMAESKITFSSHTHSHILASELPLEEFQADVSTSVSLLKENKLMSSPIFCFPGGVSTPETQAAVSRFGFRSALASDFTTNLVGPLKLLGRVGIHEDISYSTPLFCSRVWGPFCRN